MNSTNRKLLVVLQLVVMVIFIGFTIHFTMQKDWWIVLFGLILVGWQVFLVDDAYKNVKQKKTDTK